jgi:hypothetical protein
MTGLERLLLNHKGHSRSPIILVIIVSCFFQFLNAEGITNYCLNLYPPPDSLPPAPPGQAEELSGPTIACVGDISQYTIDVPVACTCQWTINGVVQSETGSPFSVTWTQPGPKSVSVVFICEGGQTTDPESMTTSVFESPEQPAPISGDEYVCEYTYHTYSTSVDPWDSCEWKVNEVIQPGYGPSITYSFGGMGTYLFEVTAYNPCGTSIERTLYVTANISTPPSVFLGNDTSIMEGQTLLLDAGNPGSIYQWSTGETTQTITVHSTGTYAVNVTNLCGSGADTINVAVYVGLDEFGKNDDCYRVACQGSRISFPELNQRNVKIQIVNLSGIIFYEGPPKEVKLSGHGIWLIRFIGPETNCYRKLLIQ